jgi:hypothetical protein
MFKLNVVQMTPGQAEVKAARGRKSVRGDDFLNGPCWPAPRYAARRFFMLRFSFGTLIALSVAALGGALGCSGEALDAGLTAPQTDAGTQSESSDGASSTGPDTPTNAGCAKDNDCNALATMSSLAGVCDQGRCRCRAGMYLVPGGKCGPDKGVGASCTSSSDCADGMECLDFTVHPKGGGCNAVGKQCTIRCDDADQQSSCTKAFGPGILCFAGCTGSEGICGLTN